MLKVILATAVLFGSFAFAEGEMKKEETTTATSTEQTAPKAGAKKGHAMKHKMEKTEKTEKKSE